MLCIWFLGNILWWNLPRLQARSDPNHEQFWRGWIKRTLNIFLPFSTCTGICDNILQEKWHPWKGKPRIVIIQWPMQWSLVCWISGPSRDGIRLQCTVEWPNNIGREKERGIGSQVHLPRSLTFAVDGPRAQWSWGHLENTSKHQNNLLHDLTGNAIVTQAQNFL